MIAYLEYIDRQLLLLINGCNSPFWDSIMVTISKTFIWIPFYLFLLYLLYRQQKRSLWLVLIFIGLLILTADQASVHLIKNVFQRYRPCHNLELKGIIHLVNGACGGMYGFVSSHAANTFGLAAFYGLIFQKKWMIATMFLWASIVSYSRIYLGVHYPSDVLGGAIVGLMVGIVYYFIFQSTTKYLSNRNKSLV